MEPDVIKDMRLTSGITMSSTYLRVLQLTDNVMELQAMLRDKHTTRGDFIFYADRLIRLVVEEALNQLPFKNCMVTTPTGEAMEQGLRDCCRSIRLGKILIQSGDDDTHEARAVYAKLPPDICHRKVLLMYPIMNTGNTVVKAMAMLEEHNIIEKNVILLNLFSTPQAILQIETKFPTLTIITTEIHTMIPKQFGQKYFGTD